MDEERRGEGLSASPAPPQRILLLAVTLLVCATVFSLFYAFRERRDAQQLAVSQQQMGLTLDQTRSQLDALHVFFADRAIVFLGIAGVAGMVHAVGFNQKLFRPLIHRNS